MSRPSLLRRRLAPLWLAAACLPPAVPAQTASLPAPLQQALRDAALPPEALSLWIAPVDEPASPWLAHRAELPVNPASLMKLATSAVALARLGPGYRWRTPVLVDQPPQDGHVAGNVYLVGRGDPQLTVERLWLLLRELRQRGVQQIDGDVVLDRQAFQLPAVDPGAFDGERYRPYNVQPDALLVSHRAVTLQFLPQPAARVAKVIATPALAGWSVPAEVPLSAEAECGDWRQRLRADFAPPDGPRFAGALPAVCGERSWPVAPPLAQRFDAQALAALWQSLGGAMAGQVRDGPAPAAALPLFEVQSPTLGEVLRDMNKFSNNLLADQLMLTLALENTSPATWDQARTLVARDLRDEARCAPEELMIDRGSGLSRSGRLSARCLGQVLQWTWRSPWMPELVASLPIAGADTARRATSGRGRAHLKTGSLDGVAGLAGFVDGPGGRRCVLAAVLNHPNAGTAGGRAVLDAALRWTVERLDAAAAPDVRIQKAP